MELQKSERVHCGRPPPLWFVTNGEVTVGPVRTGLLLRGVRHGRVPDDCLVREMRWADWRQLGQIREIAAMRRAQGARERPVRPAPRGEALICLLARAADPGEALLWGLHAAAAVTDAHVGVVHRVVGAFSDFSTCAAHGTACFDQLGSCLSADDWSLGAARAGRTVIGEAGATRVHQAIASRLGADDPLSGVLMVPVRREQELLAFFELGRKDHAFRGSDGLALSEVTRAVARAL